jgi:hypothetical protein
MSLTINGLRPFQRGYLAALMKHLQVRRLDKAIRRVEFQMAQERALHNKMVDDLVHERYTLTRKLGAIGLVKDHMNRWPYQAGGDHV